MKATTRNSDFRPVILSRLKILVVLISLYSVFRITQTYREPANQGNGYSSSRAQSSLRNSGA